MMAELIKQEVSLTVLRVRLLSAHATSAPASGARPAANQTLRPSQRTFFELQVTGNTEERGLVAPATQLDGRAQSRRRQQSGASYEALDQDAQGAPSHTLAQWSLLPEEMQLPVEYSAALRFRDRRGAPTAWLADAARLTASKLFSEIHADGLERLAAAARWLPSGKPTLPRGMVRQLQALLLPLMRDDDSLWLEIGEPAGYLPLLPWEEMLRPVTTAPILRLSPHSVHTLSMQQALSVALCVTAPSSKWLPDVEQYRVLVSAIRAALPDRSTLHVFADDLCHRLFTAAIKRVEPSDARGRTIRLHDLPRNRFEHHGPDDNGSWATWIAESLAGQAVDIVHCMSPGMLFADDARLVVTRRPVLNAPANEGQTKAACRNGRPLRYVTPLELSRALTRLGAWAVIFSAPVCGSWIEQARLGLRLLVDQIGRLRPGVAAFHDLAADRDCTALAQTYEFVIGDPSVRGSTSTAVCVYCHPARAVASAVNAVGMPVELMERCSEIKETLQAAVAQGHRLPGWIAATQRVLEQAISQTAAGADDDTSDARVRGLASALQYVERILARSVQAHATLEGVPVNQSETGGHK